MSRESTRIHRRVPKLPVSPSRSPSSASWSVGAAHVDCTLWDAEETSTTDLYDAYREEAGSNLAALPRGPKIGVHLTPVPPPTAISGFKPLQLKFRPCPAVPCCAPVPG